MKIIILCGPAMDQLLLASIAQQEISLFNPSLLVPAGLCPSADHAGHQPIGDQNLQLSGLLGLSAPPCGLGVGQQLQLEPRLCYLPGGLPGRAGKRIEWQTHFIHRCVGPYRRFFLKSSSPLHLLLCRSIWGSSPVLMSSTKTASTPGCYNTAPVPSACTTSWVRKKHICSYILVKRIDRMQCTISVIMTRRLFWMRPGNISDFF